MNIRTETDSATIEPIDYINKILFPDILRRVDQHHLLNYPRLWYTKYYYIVYWGLMVNIIVLNVVIVFSIILPSLSWITTFSSFLYTFWWIVGITTLAEVILFALWIISINNYSPEKEYAPFILNEEFVYLVIYLICLLLFIAPSFVVVTVIHGQVRHISSDVNLSQDLTYLNNIYTVFSTDSLQINEKPIEKPEIEFNIIKKYTAQEFDENIQPFDWSNFSLVISDAQKNANALNSFIANKNTFFFAVVIGFINLGLITFLFHYINIDVDSRLYLGFILFIACILIFGGAIPFLVNQKKLAHYIMALIIWGITFANSIILFGIRNILSKNNYLFLSIIIFPVTIFYSVALTLVLISPNNIEWGYAFISTLFYAPFLPYLKRRLLPFFASASFLEHKTVIFEVNDT